MLLIFFVYALCRRQRGATYAEIVRFRRRSSTVVLGSRNDDRLTALPIYRESRYSVRSSKYGSNPSVSRQGNRPPAVPPVVAQRFHSQNPWVQDAWKTANPPSPLGRKHPLSQVTPIPADITPPEMARVYSRHASQEDFKPFSDRNAGPVGPSVTVRRKSTSEVAEESSNDGSPENPQTRWSWTNSQAPPTPRIHAAPSLVSSRSSVPRFRKVKSWVQHQSARTAARMEHESRSGDRLPDLPTLKNKASKPNLAPKLTRKLSKKSLHTDTTSLIIQSNVDPASPSTPAMARVKNSW